MEHPSGKYKNAIAAMEDAVRRLRALPDWQQWITFSAQGEVPGRPDAMAFAEVRLLGDKLAVGDEPLNLAVVTQKAKLPSTVIRADGENYSVSTASSHDVALLLDAIFREHYGIRPFADEGNDYAVGAEW
jgi:hypothetical protein